MPKRALLLDLSLPARKQQQTPRRWLYESLRTAILSGRLSPGSRLPATRELAAQYAISRGTIVQVFADLRAEGYLASRIGSGTRVQQTLPENLLQAQRHRSTSLITPPSPPRLSDYAQRARAFPSLGDAPPRAFRANLPALQLFPTALWAQVSARRTRRLSLRMLMGVDPMGYKPLRSAIADYLTTSRGVLCTAEQVAIVAGAQEALDLTARIVLNPGDLVSMEDPGYIGASLVFEAIGARISAVALDQEGMQIDHQRLRGSRLIYTTPGHQYPLGTTMSLPRRLALLDWAHRNRALIFEDDYDSEYRYSGKPVTAMQGLDRHGVVLFAGSFSKVLFPSLRLGYLVLPTHLIDTFRSALSITTRHASLLDQAVVSDFISEGHFGRHLRRMREIYAERLATLMEEAKARLDGLLEVSAIEAGLQTIGWLTCGLDANTAARLAADRGVDVVSLHTFSRAHTVKPGLQMGFAAHEPRELRRGVAEIAIALESEIRARRRAAAVPRP